MFLLQDEVVPASEAFAQKFTDVIHRRKILYGPDPFQGVEISRQAKILPVEAGALEPRYTAAGRLYLAWGKRRRACRIDRRIFRPAAYVRRQPPGIGRRGVTAAEESFEALLAHSGPTAFALSRSLCV